MPAKNIHQRKTHRVRLLALVLILLGMLASAGCGKKGPLYLPDQNTADKQDPENQKQKKQQE